MKTALVISSFVGASHVGASVSAFCLRRLGVNAFILPTTMFGRHPGWGPPGGEVMSAELITDMWRGLRAQNTVIDAVLTGYMATSDQVAAAAGIIKQITADNPDVKIIVDPVMGDHGRLYVSEEVANSMIAHLLAAADIVTPNLWELEYLSGQQVETMPQILSAAQSLGCAALVTSVPRGPQIGALYYENGSAHVVTHQKFTRVPHGGGDALAGTFLAHLLTGLDPIDGLARSVSSIFEILSKAAELGLKDLPLTQYQDALLSASPLKPERLSLD